MGTQDRFGAYNQIFDALRAQTINGLGGVIGSDQQTTGGGVENKIYVWHADGSTLDTFDPTFAGLILAISAAVSGDTIWLPSVMIACTAAIVIPAGVTIIGISDRALLSFSGLSGTAVTLGIGATIAYCSVSYTSNSTTEIAIDATAIRSRVEHVHVSVTGLAATSIGIQAGTTQGLGAAREVWTLYKDITPTYFIAWSGDYFDTSSPTWHSVSVPTGYEINPHGEWSALDNNMQVCQAQDGNVYLCGTILVSGNLKYTIWQLANIAAIRLAPATAPTWTIILQEDLTTVVSGAAKVQGTFNGWALLAYQDKLYARLADANLSNAIIWSVHDGNAWTFNSIGNGSSYYPISHDGFIDEADPTTVALFNSSGGAIGTFSRAFGSLISSCLWRNSVGYYVQRIAVTNTLITRIGGGDYDTGVAGWIASRLSAPWQGTDKYFVLASGHLLRAPTDLDFSDIATWEWGQAFNISLDGSGNILWVRDTVPNGDAPFRLIQTDGTFVADRVGDFWSVVAPIVGSDDVAMLNAGLVYVDRIAGDLPLVVDSRVKSSGDNAEGLHVVGYAEALQTRLETATDIAITADGHLYVDDVAYSTLDNSGVIDPLKGDRAAFDALGYPDRHTNDTDVADDSEHHTIGTGAHQAASGTHGHDHADLSDVTADQHHNQAHILGDGGDHSDAPIDQADGFLKRNAANDAWEEVPYGTTANTVAEGDHTHGAGAGKYRQFVYTFDATTLTFLTDPDGAPLFVLRDLE